MLCVACSISRLGILRVGIGRALPQRQSSKTHAIRSHRSWALDREVSTGLASIDPFSQKTAIKYIDTFANPPSGGQRPQYEAARDLILEKLEGAFSGQASTYLSFIGYPPVLDAIATLLNEEKNYHNLLEDIQQSGHNEVEATLLYKISAYLLKREKLDKVVPNVVEGLIREFPPQVQEEINGRAYDFKEQAAQLLAYCQARPYSLEVIPQAGLNLQYEDQVDSFLHDHPFLVGGGREFRNAIFEAVCLATIIAGGTLEDLELVRSYTADRRSNLYLIQRLDHVAAGVVVLSDLIDVVIRQRHRRRRRSPLSGQTSTQKLLERSSTRWASQFWRSTIAKKNCPRKQERLFATIRTYEGYLEKWILPRWSSYRLKDIKAVSVEE